MVIRKAVRRGPYSGYLSRDELPVNPIRSGSGFVFSGSKEGILEGQRQWRLPGLVVASLLGGAVLTGVASASPISTTPRASSAASVNIAPAAGGRFAALTGIAVDTQDNIYVIGADFGNAANGSYALYKLSPVGQVLATWGLKGNPNTMLLAGLVMDKQGTFYLSDSGGRIDRLSSAGTLLAPWGKHGSRPGQFSGPDDLALDTSGNIYVADSQNNRIQKLSPTGRPLAAWSRLKGVHPSDIFGVPTVAVDVRGTVYIGDTYHDRLVELSPNGNVRRGWGKRGTHPGQFRNLAHIAVDPHGDIFAEDLAHVTSSVFYERVQKFSPGGKVLSVWSLGKNQYVRGMTFDTQSNLYLTEDVQGAPSRIAKLSPTGKELASWSVSLPA
jgi:tripartite motif-containing protein 71